MKRSYDRTAVRRCARSAQSERHATRERMEAVLDGAAMVTQRGEHWCCLLCLRQFDSLAKVRKHLIKSTMHAENLAAAVAAGRVSQPPDVSEAQSQGAKRHASASDPAEDPPAKRAAAESAPAEPPGGMSALERMELFEKHLKVQSKRQPEKEETSEVCARARANRQLDLASSQFPCLACHVSVAACADDGLVARAHGQRADGLGVRPLRHAQFRARRLLRQV